MLRLVTTSDEKIPVQSTGKTSVQLKEGNHRFSISEVDVQADRIFLNTRKVFFIFVILPTIITAFYMYVIAVDQFRSQAKILVQSSQSSTSFGGLSTFLEQSGLATSLSDTYALAEYLNSRDALEDLNKKIEFKEMMQHENADFIARYPGYEFSDSFESLYDHYLRKLIVEIDQTTNIVSISAFAFTAEDAQEITVAALEIADEFIDNLNAKSLSDALELAQSGVDRAEQKAKKVQLELTALRRQREIIDPEADLKIINEVMVNLSQSLIEVEGRISDLKRAAPNAGTIRSLERQREFLANQIQKYKNQQTSQSSEQTLAIALEKFSELELEAEFAVKALEAAHVSYESARTEALRKQIYLSRVVNPNLSDDSHYPERLRATLVVFAIMMGIFLIAWLFLANLREHAE